MEIAIKDTADKPIEVPASNVGEDDPETSAFLSACTDHNDDRSSSCNRVSCRAFNGPCVICFEDFVEGDEIVWSEDPLCQHVFHKDCMVNYLAVNAQKKTHRPYRFGHRLDVTNNPCPMCRTNYCTVRGRDLFRAKIKAIHPGRQQRRELPNWRRGRQRQRQRRWQRRRAMAIPSPSSS